MKTRSILLLLIAAVFLTACPDSQKESPSAARKTSVTISGEKILINKVPTLKGVTWNGINMEGLLPNSRMVQGIYDDLNPETVSMWKYPDTGEWDADRNTSEFVAAMPSGENTACWVFPSIFREGVPRDIQNSSPGITRP